jgi:hypothetical protein
MPASSFCFVQPPPTRAAPRPAPFLPTGRVVFGDGSDYESSYDEDESDSGGGGGTGAGGGGGRLGLAHGGAGGGAGGGSGGGGVAAAADGLVSRPKGASNEDRRAAMESFRAELEARRRQGKRAGISGTGGDAGPAGSAGLPGPSSSGAAAASSALGAARRPAGAGETPEARRMRELAATIDRSGPDGERERDVALTRERLALKRERLQERAEGRRRLNPDEYGGFSAYASLERAGLAAESPSPEPRDSPGPYYGASSGGDPLAGLYDSPGARGGGGGGGGESDGDTAGPPRSAPRFVSFGNAVDHHSRSGDDDGYSERTETTVSSAAPPPPSYGAPAPPQQQQQQQQYQQQQYQQQEHSLQSSSLQVPSHQSQQRHHLEPPGGAGFAGAGTDAADAAEDDTASRSGGQRQRRPRSNTQLRNTPFGSPNFSYHRPRDADLNANDDLIMQLRHAGDGDDALLARSSQGHTGAGRGGTSLAAASAAGPNAALVDVDTLPVHERLMAEGEARRARHRERRRLAFKESGDYPFVPQLSTKARRLQRRSLQPGGGQGGEERVSLADDLARRQAERDARLERLRRERDEEEAKELTFKPKLLSSTRALMRGRGGADAAVERLAKGGTKASRGKHGPERRASDDDDEAELTFQPEISEKARALRRTLSDMEQWRHDRDRRRAELEEQRLDEELAECTFQPQISRETRKIVDRTDRPGRVEDALLARAEHARLKREQTLEAEARERARLAKPKPSAHSANYRRLGNITQKSYPLYAAEGNHNGNNSSGNSGTNNTSDHSSSTLHASRDGGSGGAASHTPTIHPRSQALERSEPVEDRLLSAHAAAIARRAAAAEARERAQRDAQGRPRINAASRVIAGDAERRAGVTAKDRLLGKSAPTKAAGGGNASGDDGGAASADDDGASASDVVQVAWAGRRERAVREAEEREREECTFRPRRVTADNADGSATRRPGPAGGSGGVAVHERLHGVAQAQRQSIEAKRARKEQAELAECTFHPKIGDAGRRAAEVTGNGSIVVAEQPRDADEIMSDLVNRNIEWQRRREARLEAERKKKELDEFKECTFAPKGSAGGGGGGSGAGGSGTGGSGTGGGVPRTPMATTRAWEERLAAGTPTPGARRHQQQQQQQRHAKGGRNPKAGGGGSASAAAPMTPLQLALLRNEMANEARSSAKKRTGR